MPSTKSKDQRLAICRSLGIKDLVGLHSLIMESLQKGPAVLLQKKLNSKQLVSLGYSAEATCKLGFKPEALENLGFRIQKPATDAGPEPRPESGTTSRSEAVTSNENRVCHRH
jgi:hypothetical protein